MPGASAGEIGRSAQISFITVCVVVSAEASGRGTAGSPPRRWAEGTVASHGRRRDPVGPADNEAQHHRAAAPRRRQPAGTPWRSTCALDAPFHRMPPRIRTVRDNFRRPFTHSPKGGEAFPPRRPALKSRYGPDLLLVAGESVLEGREPGLSVRVAGAAAGPSFRLAPHWGTAPSVVVHRARAAPQQGRR